MPEAIRLEPLADRHVPGVAALLADPGVLREGFAAVDAGGGFLGLALAPTEHAGGT